MNRDNLYTFGGLVLVGAVIVAAFLYGNSQRQSQIRTDQDKQRTQQAAQTPNSGQANGPDQQPSAVKPSDSQTALQGSGAAGGTEKTPTSTPAPAAQPDAMVGITETPKTGGSVAYLIGPLALLYGYRKLRHSRRQIRSALLA